MSQRPVKTVFVGDGTVGKTCMIWRFVSKEFPTDWVPSVFNHQKVEIPLNDCVALLSIWDTGGGGEDYPRVRPLSYRSANVFALSFSVSNRASFEHVETYWLPELQQHCPDVPIVLIGTKIDLRDDTKQDENFISKHEGMEMMTRIGAVEYHETSSLTTHGVEDVFECLATVGVRQSEKQTCTVS